MAEQTTISLYRLQGFLILHWQLPAPLTTNAIQILLDKLELPKPFVVVSFDQAQEFFIIVNAAKLTLRKKKYALRIINAKDGSVLAEAKAAVLTPFSSDILAQLSAVKQAKVFNALFNGTLEIFKTQLHAEHTQILQSFARQNVEVYALNSEQYFVRFAWNLAVANTLAEGKLFSQTAVERTDLGSHAVFIDQGYLNFVIPQSSAISAQGNALLVIKSLGVFPFVLSDAKKVNLSELALELNAQAKGLENTLAFVQSMLPTPAIVPPLSFEYQGGLVGIHKGVVYGWAVDKLNPMQPLSLQVYIDQKLQEKVLANLPAADLPVLLDVGPYGFQWPVAPELLDGQQHELSFLYPGTAQHIQGSPILLGRGRFDYQFQLEQGYKLTGWMRERVIGLSQFSLEIYLDDTFLTRLSFSSEVIETLNYELPRQVFDSQVHKAKIILLDQDNAFVYAEMFRLQHSYQGLVEKITWQGVNGWIINEKYPELPVVIDAKINDSQLLQVTANIKRPDVQLQKNLESAEVGFSLTWPESSLLDTASSIELYIAGTDCLVSPHKSIITPKDIIIRSLISAAEHLRAQDSALDGGEKVLSSALRLAPSATEWVIRQVLAPTINALRAAQELPDSLRLSFSGRTQIPAGSQSAVVDVIIPVYQGYDETMACIQSVLQAKTEIPHQIIVVNDRSPDGRLSNALQGLAQGQQITLLNNEQNLGFVASVNKGMALHSDRDVILLNSDTLVADHWLDRLQRAAHSNHNIGSVTPFSNNATICSFPTFNQDNDLLSGMELADIDQLFAAANQGRVVDLPTAVGFCMYIKRQTLRDAGYFDEKTWGLGYGEENDFCLRTACFGWRHVLAADVFVQHHGSVSFAGKKQRQLSHNLNILQQRFPDYAATVQRFIQQDPLAPMRNKVLLQMLQKFSHRYLLFVMHSLGGGAKTNGDDLAELLKQQGQAVLELTTSGKHWVLSVLGAPELCLKYRYPEDFSQLLADCKTLNIWRVHYHQTLGFPKSVWTLPTALDVEYDFTAHDFLPMCPRINLIDETGSYCGEAQFDAQKCSRCVQINGFTSGLGLEENYAEHGGTVQGWREFYQQVLQSAKHVFAPSKTTADLYKQHFNLTNLSIKPHPEVAFTIHTTTPKITKQAEISVAVIGAIGPHKGYDILLACAKNALKLGLPLKFVVLGYTSNDQELGKLENVVITGKYQKDELPGLISEHRCTLALFLSVWPETFCYTLTEALQNNLYPIAFNLGAIAERINALGFGGIIPFTSDTKIINQTLMTVGFNARRTKTLNYPGKQYPNILQQYYELEAEGNAPKESLANASD